jgi:hypothetical protein
MVRNVGVAYRDARVGHWWRIVPSSKKDRVGIRWILMSGYDVEHSTTPHGAWDRRVLGTDLPTARQRLEEYLALP